MIYLRWLWQPWLGRNAFVCLFSFRFSLSTSLHEFNNIDVFYLYFTGVAFFISLQLLPIAFTYRPMRTFMLMTQIRKAHILQRQTDNLSDSQKTVNVLNYSHFLIKFVLNALSLNKYNIVRLWRNLCTRYVYLINQSRIRSLDQQVLSHTDTASCSKKQGMGSDGVRTYDGPTTFRYFVQRTNYLKTTKGQFWLVRLNFKTS